MSKQSEEDGDSSNSQAHSPEELQSSTSDKTDLMEQILKQDRDAEEQQQQSDFSDTEDQQQQSDTEDQLQQSDTEHRLQRSDTEDQLQQSSLIPDGMNSALQQRNESRAEQVSCCSTPTDEDEDNEYHYDQQYKESQDEPDWEPKYAQDHHKTLTSTGGKATYPMKSKRNVSTVHLIVADDDEGAVREEGKACVCIYA